MTLKFGNTATLNLKYLAWNHGIRNVFKIALNHRLIEFWIRNLFPDENEESRDKISGKSEVHRPHDETCYMSQFMFLPFVVIIEIAYSAGHEASASPSCKWKPPI